MKQVTAYIGLGSNLGQSEKTIMEAFSALAALPRTRLVKRSSLYETEPMGDIQQPDFLNAACSLETGLTAEVLLESLLGIESAAGRQRLGEQGGPRTLDLDLLIYGHERINLPGLQVPHPRMHERAFVLYPLSEIAPDLEITGRGAVEGLRANCSSQTIRRIE